MYADVDLPVMPLTGIALRDVDGGQIYSSSWGSLTYPRSYLRWYVLESNPYKFKPVVF